MADATATSLSPLAGPPAALSADAWLLEPPPAHERSGLLREESARLVDSLLVRVARGSGALDVAIGDGLGVLSVGDRTLRLGFSGIGDYARERLGMEPAAGKRMARLGQALRERPALREAVRRGEVSARKATAVLAVARGDADAGWVERARTSTVRALEAAVRAERAALGAGADPSDAPWETLALALGPEERARVDAALEVAGKLLGVTSPRWQRLEAMAQEFLGSHFDARSAADVEADEGEGAGGLDPSSAEWLEAARAALEEETACWSALDAFAPIAAPAQDPGRSRADSSLRCSPYGSSTAALLAPHAPDLGSGFCACWEDRRTHRVLCARTRDET